jgi:hypothetical protein
VETPLGTVPDRFLDRMSMAEVHEYLQARVSRRAFLRAALVGAGALAAGPILWRRPGFAAVPPAGRHLAFGADPKTQMAASWLTAETVTNPTLDIGLTTGYELGSVAAETRSVVGTPSVYHHAALSGLTAGQQYHYRLRHDGAASADATFRTAPASPGAFTFTSFGDQGTSADAVAIASRVAAENPAFHFHVGDLCYAYRTGTGDLTRPADFSPVLRPILTNQATWDQWLGIVDAQASRAPWMPTVGNHEMEYGYGSLGYDGYLSRFTLPGTGPSGAPVVYVFRYGNVGVIALDGNDASHEIPSNNDYVGAAQDAWLGSTLASLRADPAIDFVVVGFHYCAYCTNVVHASDGGMRDRWGALFDQHRVDLVINGHNHSYERTHPLIGGAVTKDAPTGATVSPAVDGTTYVTAGGGGQAAYQVSLYPASYVWLARGVRAPETAEWSAVRYLDYSLIAVDVAPPDGAGETTMTLRALSAAGAEVDRVVLRRQHGT